MTKLKSGFILIPVILFSVILSSCLSVNRNIKIKKDGSGEETMKITFQKQFYNLMSSMSSMMDSVRRQGYLDSLYSDELFLSQTKNKYDSIPGIKVIGLSTEKGPDSSNSIIIKYQFDSVIKIGQSMGSLKEDESSSITDVSWNKEGDKIFFNYTYEESPQEKAAVNDSTSAEIKNSMSEVFAGGSFNITIDFPYEVISSNATSREGNLLHWTYTMPEVIMQGKMKLEAVLKEN